MANKFAVNKLGCTQSCPPSCEQSTYSTSVSTGKWPSFKYWSTIVYNLGFDGDVSKLVQQHESTFLKISVYFDSLIVEKVESQPAYSWNRLLVEIGGQLGLLLGFSLLTAVEILELLLVDLGAGLGFKTFRK